MPKPARSASAEHQRGAPALDGIGDHQTTAVPVGGRVKIPVLDCLQLVAIAAPKPVGGRLHMNVVDMARAVGMAGDGIEQGGTDDVADLETGVIIAVAECRQFDNARITPCRRAELLREDRVGNADILELIPAVGDAGADVVGSGQVMVEVAAYALYRRGVDRCCVENGAGSLDPDAGDKPGLVTLQQAHDAIEKAVGMEALARVSPCRVPADFSAFDFGQDPVRRLGRRIGQVRKIPVLQGEEVGCEGHEVRGVDEEPADDQDGLIVRLRRIGEWSEIPRLVDEADFHLGPKNGYGHPGVAIGSAARYGVGNLEVLGTSYGISAQECQSPNSRIRL